MVYRKKQKSTRHWLLPLLCLPVLLAACSGSCAGMFAESLVYANRQPLIKNPQDYGMEYRDIQFQSPDSITIRGWLIPGTRETLAIMTHPMNFTRYGYSTKHQGRFKITNIEVEFLKTARNLHQAGHNVLSFDFRNHGASGDSPDRIFGLGMFEWQDVAGCLDYIHNNEELKDKQLFFVSFCNGANSTIIAMNNAPSRFKNVRCLAAIQPISMEVFVTNFMKDKYQLFTGMIPDIEQAAVDMGMMPFAQMSPLDYVQGIFLPTLYVQAEADKWTDIEYVKAMYENTPQPKELLLLEGEKMHRFDTYNYFGDHPEQLLTFIDKYVDG